MHWEIQRLSIAEGGEPCAERIAPANGTRRLQDRRFARLLAGDLFHDLPIPLAEQSLSHSFRLTGRQPVDFSAHIAVEPVSGTVRFE